MIKQLTYFLFFVLSLTVAPINAKDSGWKHANYLKIVFEQKIISQDLAKKYIYLDQGIQADRTREEIKKSALIYQNNNKKLAEYDDDMVRSLAEFAAFQTEEFISLIEQPYSIENALIIMDTADVLVEAYSEIFNNIAKEIKSKELVLVRMADDAVLANIRIGKFYLAGKAGISNYNIQSQISADSKILEKELTLLAKETKLDKSVRFSIKNAKKLWGFIRKFVNNMDKSQLPIMVDHSTKTIEKDLTRVVKSLLENI